MTMGDQLDSLVQTKELPDDIEMSFGLDKFAVLEIKKGRNLNNTGIGLQDNQQIYSEDRRMQISWNSTARLDIKHQDEGQIAKEHIRRVKKLCKSKSNGGNLKNVLNA